jgi:hypothetical protein
MRRTPMAGAGAALLERGAAAARFGAGHNAGFPRAVKNRQQMLPKASALLAGVHIVQEALGEEGGVGALKAVARPGGVPVAALEADHAVALCEHPACSRLPSAPRSARLLDVVQYGVGAAEVYHEVDRGAVNAGAV